MAAASPSTSSRATIRPETPSRTTAGTPPTSVATTAIAAGAGLDQADRRALRVGRQRDHVGGVEQPADVVAVAREREPGPSCRRPRLVSSDVRRLPSPITRKRVSGVATRTAAARKRSARFTGTSRPANATERLRRRHAEPGARLPRMRSCSPSRRRARACRVRPGWCGSCAGGAIPSSIRSSRTWSETATRQSVCRASRRSTRRKTCSTRGSKYPRSTCPWNVCTTAGTRTRRAARAPDRPGLGGVRVHDRRPKATEHPCHLDRRECVGHAGFALEAADRDPVEAEPVGQLVQRSLVRRRVAVDQHAREAMLADRGGGQDRLRDGTADREPGDDVGDEGRHRHIRTRNAYDADT